MVRPEVSIVIISWNDRERLRGCLGSLPDDAGTEVIVVDNGSKDGTVEMVSRRFPRARLVVNRSNRGVARARNQAVALARGDFFLLLDSDTIVGQNAVGSLLAYIRSEPGVGLAAPRLVGEDGRTQLTCRSFPTLWTTICRRLDRIGFFRRRPALRRQMLSDWDHRTARDVDYVIGACQMIRREAWESVGPLDERIFFGPEDVDFCLRVKRGGWRVVYYPRAVVEHAEKRQTRSMLKISHWRHVLGVLYFFNKHRYLLSRRRAMKYFAREGAAGAGGSHGDGKVRSERTVCLI